MSDSLILLIKEIQKTNGLSDRQFALSLEIDPSLWSKIQSGAMSPGLKFLRAISRKYPALRDAISEYISGEEAPVA
jgi:transcriptional regulator with XRE-family HTH domain